MQVRCTVLSHFNSSLDEYDIIFTSGATDAVKCLASLFPWTSGLIWLHNHNFYCSVNFFSLYVMLANI